MSAELGIAVVPAANVQDLVSDADIVCTLTSAAEPILKGGWLRPGTHVKLVGSSFKSLGHVVQDLASAWALYAERNFA